MVIKSAVIPSMNSSWPRSQGEKAKDGQTGRGETTGARGRGDAGGKARMAFDAQTSGLSKQQRSAALRFRADVLTVSGSMEGEIPTKGGVQILWEIRPLFNIS